MHPPLILKEDGGVGSGRLMFCESSKKEQGEEFQMRKRKCQKKKNSGGGISCQSIAS